MERAYMNFQGLDCQRNVNSQNRFLSSHLENINPKQKKICLVHRPPTILSLHPCHLYLLDTLRYELMNENR